MNLRRVLLFQITKYLEQVVAPLYFLNVACDIAFLIAFSPTISVKWIQTVHDIQEVSLISDVLEFTVLAALYASLLVMAQRDWRAENSVRDFGG